MTIDELIAYAKQRANIAEQKMRNERAAGSDVANWSQAHAEKMWAIAEVLESLKHGNPSF